MLLLDANVFLRALVLSDDSALDRAHRIARQLFLDIDSGKVEAIVSDAVLAEVAFILTARSHYSLPAEEAALKLKAIVSLRGLRTSQREVILSALDLWASMPRLGFVDALVAAQARRLDVQLVTFDSDFDDIDGINRWQPPEKEALNE